MNENRQENELSLKDYFVPLTTAKAITFIIIIGFIVFFNTLFNGFIWDDFDFIINNSFIHNFNIFSLFKENMFNSGGYYRPIPAVYFSLLWNLFNNLSFFYHLTQIMLHILCTCLLFNFLKIFFKKNLLVFFLSLIFLVHPIQVESVSYIGASQSELFFLFGISAFLISLKEKHTWKYSIIISILFLLSLLTKETALLFIIMIGIYYLLFNYKSLFKLLPYLIGTIVLYGLIRFEYAKIFLVKNLSTPIGNLNFAERLINIPAIFFYYIKTFFYPKDLAIDQRWIIHSINFQQFYLPLIMDCIFIFFLGVLGLIVYRNNRDLFKLFIFFVAWFLIGLGLLLQIFPLDMTVADRWFYLPLVGIIGILGISIYSFNISNKGMRTVLYSLAIFVLVILSIRSIARNANFHDALNLYAHDSKISSNYDIETLYGVELAMAQKKNEALHHFLKASTLYPEQTNLVDVASMYDDLDNKEKAKEYYYKALNTKSNVTYNSSLVQNTYLRLGRLLIQRGEYKEAKELLKKAVVDFSDSGNLWYFLAVSEYKLKEWDSALVDAKKAVILLPTEEIKAFYNKVVNNYSILYRKLIVK